MNVTRLQIEQPLNRKAEELLRQMKVNPSDDMLAIVLLLIVADIMPDIVVAKLHQPDSKSVMKQVMPALPLTDLDDATPYQAAKLPALEGASEPGFNIGLLPRLE